MICEQLIQSAVFAPSGDNCQPWRFQVRGDSIRIFNAPERDTSVYNEGQRASFVAHGALLETLAIAAAQGGYEARVSVFPDARTRDLVATVSVVPGTTRGHPLYPEIRRRTTNRKRYSSRRLESAHADVLARCCHSEWGSLRLFDSGCARSSLTEALGLHDRILFENERLHEFLFAHIRWTAEEASRSRDGMDLRTLELSPVNRLVFPLLRSWRYVRFMNLLGLSRMVCRDARLLADSAAALGVISVPGNSQAAFVQGGRLLQRVWLEATRLGLSFQLCAGTAFLLESVKDGRGEKLSSLQRARLRKIDSEVRRDCRIPENHALLALLRIGYGEPPSARSLRRTPVISG